MKTPKKPADVPVFFRRSAAFFFRYQNAAVFRKNTETTAGFVENKQPDFFENPAVD